MMVVQMQPFAALLANMTQMITWSCLWYTNSRPRTVHVGTLYSQRGQCDAVTCRRSTCGICANRPLALKVSVTWDGAQSDCPQEQASWPAHERCHCAGDAVFNVLVGVGPSPKHPGPVTARLPYVRPRQESSRWPQPDGVMAAVV
jgi:hypothetical protein